MIPYYTFLVVTLLIAFLAYREQKTKRIYLLFLILLMSLFAGFRSISVGTDTSEYARSFEDIYQNNTQIGKGLSSLTDEPGYYYLEKALGLISNDYYVLLIGIALVFSFFVVLSIGKTSRMPLISYLVFITLGYYTFVFNAARQGLAMAIYMMSFPFIINKQFWKYTIFVLIAALFHKTIIIAIPLYFFFTMRFSFQSLLLAIVGGIAMALFLPEFLNYGATLEERYAIFSEGSATGGYLLTVFYALLTIFFIYQRSSIRKQARPVYDVFLNMLIVGTAVYLIVSLTGSYVELTRFAAYFQIASVFLWPLLIKDKKVPINKAVLIIALVGHLGFFAIYLSKMAGLTPYVLNPDLFNGLL